MGVPGNANALLLRSAAAAGGYQVSRSLRFNGTADSTYLSRTPASAGNQKTWTWSGWVKRSDVTSSSRNMLISVHTPTTYFLFEYNAGHSFAINDSGGPSLSTSAVFRDASAWYHVVLAVDTTQATSSNRIKVYVNGTQQTLSGTQPNQNVDLVFNQAYLHTIGAVYVNSTYYHGFNGYLADIWFLDGIAATPSDFAETDATTGQWIPKTYSGSKGSNGFHLEFADNSNNTASTLGKDTANSNNWTPNNFSVTAGAGNDSLVDTPTSVSATDTGIGGEIRGNYCTWNPLAKNSALNLANGNLDDSTGTPGIDGIGLGTIGASVGKFYWELTVNSTSGGNNPIIGVVPTSAGLIEVGSNNANSVGYLQSGSKRINGSTTSYGNSFTTGDVVGVALDLDNGAIYFSKNGTWQNSGVPTSGSSKTGAAHTWTGGSVEMTPAVREYNSSCSANWGQRSWAYQAPAGFKALCDTNLGTPTIIKPSTVMDVKLYTGNGSTQTISGLGFSPDFVWVKQRSGTQFHRLQDTIRGTSKVLYSNGTDPEDTTSNDITAFNSDGFSVGSFINTSSATYVAWAFDGGTSTVNNTQGSITSSVRANASAGFSIVTYTGANSTASTVGHGLGVVPGMVIVKNRTGSGYQWRVWHSYFGTSTTKTLLLSVTNGEVTGSTDGYITGLTSTVFGFGGGTAAVNASSTDYVAYCFAPVAGYSSFGSYTGNGSSTDGPFVFTGHRSRWILIKQSSSAGENWAIFDTARDTYNVASTNLFPNLSSAEASASFRNIDILSNGFKIRNADGTFNTNGATYIWASFAESPFAYARAR